MLSKEILESIDKDFQNKLQQFTVEVNKGVNARINELTEAMSNTNGVITQEVINAYKDSARTMLNALKEAYDITTNGSEQTNVVAEQSTVNTEQQTVTPSEEQKTVEDVIAESNNDARDEIPYPQEEKQTLDASKLFG